jgi:hypothetical protein
MKKPNYCIVLPEKENKKEIKKYFKGICFKSLIQEGSDLISIFDKVEITATSPNIISILELNQRIEGRNVKAPSIPADIEQVLASFGAAHEKTHKRHRQLLCQWYDALLQHPPE